MAEQSGHVGQVILVKASRPMLQGTLLIRNDQQNIRTFAIFE
jgi:hypothetical protein